MALPVSRTNLLTNPSFETNAAGWDANISRQTSIANRVFAGTAYGQTGAGTVTESVKAPATAGLPYAASAYLARGATAKSVAVQPVFYDAGNVELSPVTPTLVAIPINDALYRYSDVRTAPAGTTQVAFRITMSAAIITVDGALLEQSATVDPFFDGSTPDEANYRYEWTGTAHASTSTRDYYGIWVEQVAGAGAPKVQVTAIGLGDVSVQTQVTRETGGETWTVPGWKRRNTLGGDTIADHTAPLGRPVSYTLIVNGQTVNSMTITVTSATGWVQSPTQPEIAMPIALNGMDPSTLALAKPALKSMKYEIEGTEEMPMGGRYPIARTGNRQAASDLSYILNAHTNETSDEFLSLIQNAGIVLFRSLPTWGSLPALGYLLGGVEEAPFNRDRGGSFTQWMAGGRLVAPVSIAPLTGMVTNAMVATNLAGRTNASVAAASSGKRNIDIAAAPLELG